jgi:hypothetical protein
LKSVKLHIIFSWILLLCFVAGQYMVYAHQHHAKIHAVVVNKKPFPPTVKERCDLCDAMHHNVMLPGVQPQLPVIYSMSYFHFVASEQGFVPIGLVLASGRAPPVV